MAHPRRLSLVAVLLACALQLRPVSSDFSWSRGSPVRWSKDELQSLEQQPVFDNADVKSGAAITVQVGQTAYLPCRVKHLGDKVISWIRQRDLHILTSGPHTYTSDARVEVVHPPNSDLWTLRIVSARPSDKGRYECQVNTEPKMMRAVLLDVRNDADMKDSPYVTADSKVTPRKDVSGSPEVQISGPNEQFVQTGTTVTFTCVAKWTKGSVNVAWYHGDLPVSHRQGFRPISVDTERSDGGATSRITLAQVQQIDSGNYTCVAAATAPEANAASVALIVVEGEHTEAMQRDMGNDACSQGPVWFVLVSTGALLLFCRA
ncbi:hemicentin-1-like [Neocloeon triangulifer]|uniref:hemicentin-1-like n=1 Tax=Neocloeon triangulifer TaxID=2078957 RepID=UPI00286FA8BF|nr:hemicentin-1-like [Neocloeon triangulifer]